jgi:hypothetical protein
LGKGGEALGLFAADGTTINAITFGVQTSDVTQGRYPDGAANIFPLALPTPGAANFLSLSNTPPTLNPISPKSVTLGQTLSFTASATDTDVPAQSLSFSLGAGSPSGAAINSASGQFTWTPSAAPATNSISIIVADSGVPSLSATQAVSVTVYLPATIAVQVNGNQMQLTWPRGTLQAADEVTGPYLDIPATSPFVVPYSGTKRFFRIRL